MAALSRSRREPPQARRWRLAAAFLVLALLSARTVEAQPALVPYRDARGFSVQMPPGWRVEAASLDRIAISDPAYLAFALIRARVVRGDLEAWLSGQYLTTETWVRQPVLMTAEAVGPDVARAAFRVVDANGIGKRVNVLAVRRGEIATLFVAAAPEPQFGQALPLLAAILDSFRFGGPAPGGTSDSGRPPEIEFVSWVDPVENAFSTEVPRGWTVSGGMRLRGAYVKKPVVTVVSPDQRAVFFLGNADIPTFTLPSPLLASLGYREGSNGGTPGSVVSRYREAADFGTSLIQSYLGRTTITARRDRPDVIAPYLARPIVGQPFGSAADLEFRAADGRIGQVTIATYGYEVPGTGGAWNVEECYGFVAPPEMAATAARGLGRFIGALRVNPSWFAAEVRIGAEEARRLAAAREHSARLQQQTLEHRWAVQDRQGREFRDALTNTARLLDPQTGEAFETRADSRYFYRIPNAHTPTIVGTEVDSNPDPVDMRRLMQFGVDLPYR